MTPAAAMRELLASLTPRRLLAVSVGVAVVTIVLKTLAWWITGSVGLLSEDMENRQSQRIQHLCGLQRDYFWCVAKCVSKCLLRCYTMKHTAHSECIT